MSNREKLLAAIAGVFVGVLVLYMGLRVVLLSPVAKIDERAAKVGLEIDRLTGRHKIYQSRAGRLDGLGRRTLGRDVNRAKEAVRTRLVELLQRSGMGEESMTLTPSPGPKLKNYYKEVGWIVGDDGELENVMDFLYLLSAEPYLHRVENLTLTPVSGTTRMQVRLRYATLVLISPKERELPVGEPPGPENASDLEGEERAQYAVIAQRDVFRPYRRYVAAQRPTPRPAPTREPEREAPEPRPVDSQSRVVSLATWAGEQEVHVRDTRKNELRTYKTGESLGGGKIVMIDYRMMPLPGKPYINSTSRVILRIGRDYWAVELGQNLTDKRRLRSADLPGELRGESE